MSNRSRKFFTIFGVSVFLLGVLVIVFPQLLIILAWVYFAIIASGGTDFFDFDDEKIADRGVYYRITALYLVDDVEPLDFDIVVACGRYRAKTRSSDKGLIPTVYAKRTASNHAVLVKIPDFCNVVQSRILGQISGTFDGAFLPFTVWFEDATDLGMGLGFASIYAFDNPASRLTFLGATIRYASREEFEDWYTLRNDNLISTEMLRSSPYTGTGWLREENKALPERCYGIGFVQGNDATQGILSAYWPDDFPEYWSEAQIGWESWLELYNELRRNDEAQLRSYDISSTTLGRNDYNLDWSEPNKSRGDFSLNLGKLSNYFRFRYIPTEQYPVYFNDAIPLLKEGLGAPYLAVDIDLRPEMKGFVACYTRYSPKGRLKGAERPSAIDHYFGGPRRFNDFRLQVNGDTVFRTKGFSALADHLVRSNEAIGKFNQFSIKQNDHVD
ncbi:MAG: hypothetical protein AAGA50_24245 [Pseudomonadota bacterium]